MPATEQRVMRISLPVPLIREMDTVILKGIGGYSTRAEFIVDAIQERILELSGDGTEDAGPPPVSSTERADVAPATELLLQRAAAAAPSTVSVPMTALAAPTTGFVVSMAEDLSRPEAGPLFGLHNRDYPSLWALARLAWLTQEQPIPVEDYFAEVLAEAWRFGELLLAIEKHTGTKCTALFPTNTEKRKPAEMGFRSFAVGDYRTEGDAYATTGPLFVWRLVGLTAGEPAAPRIGLTDAGWKLLAGITGISVEQPHPPTAAKVFFSHISSHAPEDRRGFTEIVRAIGPDGATRQNVLDHVARVWTSWTDNEVSTNSAGYIARAREWGLVEPKQAMSQYHLTPLGHECFKGGEL